MKLIRSGLAVATVVGSLLANAAVIAAEAAGGPNANDAVAKPFVIEKEGDHQISADDRTALIAAVHAEDGGLRYAVSVQRKDKSRAALTQAPKKLCKGWFMVADGPSVWVFDGDQAIELFNREYVDDTPGIESRTAKEFPDIMKRAPKLFVDRLPPAMRK
ncbi:hypothetical protein LBMAG57_35340 [Verrucomicrobiota bacterium]|nr:hypothetical protein LBMAG57_35340 [Verrucomicrobiota bacterium]